MRERLRQAVPYVLVVLASWGGSWLWYEENEDRRAQTVEDVTTEIYSEDVDSCLRVNASVRDPAHEFFDAIREAKEVEQSLQAVYLSAVRATKAIKGQPCITVVGQPEGARDYEPDLNEVNGIPAKGAPTDAR